MGYSFLAKQKNYPLDFLFKQGQMNILFTISESNFDLNQYFKASEVENYVFYKVTKVLLRDEECKAVSTSAFVYKNIFRK